MITATEIERLYDRLWEAHDGDDFAFLDREHHVRTPQILFDMLEGLSLSSNTIIVDLACGRGEQAVALAQRFGGRVLGLDLRHVHARDLKERGDNAEVQGSVWACAAAMAALPLKRATVDLVWFSDALEHAVDVTVLFAEASRVLKAGGHLLLYSGYATTLLEVEERRALCSALALNPAALDGAVVNRAAAEVGFREVTSFDLGSEPAEHEEMRRHRCSRELLRIARLIRFEAEYRQRLGDYTYDVALGLYRWTVYQLLGKISYRASLYRAAG